MARLTLEELTQAGIRILDVQAVDGYRATLLEQKERAQRQFNAALVELAALDAKLETVERVSADDRSQIKPTSE